MPRSPLTLGVLLTVLLTGLLSGGIIGSAEARAAGPTAGPTRDGFDGHDACVLRTSSLTTRNGRILMRVPPGTLAGADQRDMGRKRVPVVVNGAWGYLRGKNISSIPASVANGEGMSAKDLCAQWAASQELLEPNTTHSRSPEASCTE